MEIERALFGMAHAFVAPAKDEAFAVLLASLGDVGPDHPHLKVRLRARACALT